jgi:hypothetical protein
MYRLFERSCIYRYPEPLEPGGGMVDLNQDEPTGDITFNHGGQEYKFTPEQIATMARDVQRAAEKERGADARFRELAEKEKEWKAKLEQSEDAIQLADEMRRANEGDEDAIRSLYKRNGYTEEQANAYIAQLKGDTTVTTTTTQPKDDDSDGVTWEQIGQIPEGNMPKDLQKILGVFKRLGVDPAEALSTVLNSNSYFVEKESMGEIDKELQGVLQERRKSGKMVPSEAALGRLAEEVYTDLTNRMRTKSVKWTPASIRETISERLYLLDELSPQVADRPRDIVQELGDPTRGTSRLYSPVDPSTEHVLGGYQDDKYPEYDHKAAMNDLEYDGKLAARRIEWARRQANE